MSTGFRKPKVSEVKWVVIVDTDMVKVETVREGEHAGFFYRVTPKAKGSRAKTFYGETAWQDSRRFSSDIDFQSAIEGWGW